MPKKALASLNVVINAVTGPFARGLKNAERKLKRFGSKMKSIGSSITSSFTMPFAAISVAGAKMALDFEKNMTKINTLVGISADEVNALSKDVMRLSGETAQAPTELADGLFFLTSAGLRGANAIETLEAVSKGAAIGLGEQADLAKVAAAAQNAYGKENLSAAKALDIFGGAVREGMFEASDLAEVLGTQLGLASSLGISFEEVNAFIATYTKTTGDAKSASTSFGGVMMALAKTTPQMERALNQVGMTGDSVREMLGDQGLRSTLINIKTAFEENNVPLTQFFSKSQALKGVLGVLGEQTETYGNVLDGMGTSVGMVEDGFSTLEEQTGFKMQQAFNNLKNASMELGAILMPLFTTIVDGAVSFAKSFTELDSGTKKLVAGAAALLAASGPLMMLGGTVATAIGMILTPTGLVIAALGLIFKIIYDNWGATRKIFVDFVNYFIELYNESQGFRMIVEGIKLSFQTLWYVVAFFFEAAVQVVSNFGKYFKNIFSGIGDIIMGVFTLDKNMVKKGLKDLADGLGKTLDEGIDDIDKKWSKKLSDAVDKAKSNIKGKEKVEFITEDQVQGNVDNVVGWINKNLKNAQDKIKGFLGGSILAVPDGSGGGSGGGTDGGGTDGGDDGSNLGKTLEKKKSMLQKYFEWAKTGYAGFVENVQGAWNKISQIAGAVLDGIGNLFAAQHEKQMTLLDNETKKKNENLQSDFEREALSIENSRMSQEQKDDALIKLKEKFEKKQQKIDKDADDKKKALMKKQAIREKGLRIANAIMATAQAVVQALTAGPVAGPILAAIVGGLGAAQIATIASTPIPLAEGGLIFGPTNAIVGDNPNAQNDPEVVAPLSKLKNMLGGEMNMQVNVGGIVKGNDIYLSNENTIEQRERYI